MRTIPIFTCLVVALCAPSARAAPAETPADPGVVPAEQPAVQTPGGTEPAPAPEPAVPFPSEAQPTEAAPLPAAESAPAPAPEPEPEPEPESQSGLPSYAAIPEYQEAPPPPPEYVEYVEDVEPNLRPPTGRGRQAVGGILLGGGITLIGISATMIAIDEDVAVWIPGTVLGFGAAIGGAASLIGGHVRHQRYQQWMSENGGEGAPPAGVGMIASGVTCMSAGTFGMLVGGLSLLLQGEGDLPYGQVMVPLGATSVATGLGLTIAGARRNKRFNRWDEGQAPTPSVSLLRGRGRNVGGAVVGLSGRF